METIENNLPSATHQEKAKKMKKLRRWQIAISLLGVAIIVWGVIEVICLFLNYSQTETSNDAQIEQYVSPINLRASGYIDKIYFTEHQEVHKGDTLLVLDDREYKIRVMEAEAALKDAQAGATVINATLNTTQTTASVYDASIAEIEVRLAKLEKDRKRYEKTRSLYGGVFERLRSSRRGRKQQNSGQQDKKRFSIIHMEQLFETLRGGYVSSSPEGSSFKTSVRF